MGENREYKSDVFSMLLGYPENALDVYNALNHTNYDDPTLVEMKRLDKGISLSVRNDAAFLIDFYLNIYEHQSTYNPNMPVRSLIYFADIIGPMVKGQDLYQRKLIKIPTPHFVVFYNGEEKRPEKETLYLSTAYEKQTEDPELELKVTVYNINVSHNKEFMENCKILQEYMFFVDKVRGYQKDKVPLEDAIEQSINECIREHVLEDFLRNRKDEVKKSMTLDYTWERREELIRKEERAEGREEGEVKKTVSIICKKLEKKLTEEEIADMIEEDLAIVQAISEIAKTYAPKYDVDRICQTYMETKKQA